MKNIKSLVGGAAFFIVMALFSLLIDSKVNWPAIIIGTVIYTALDIVGDMLLCHVKSDKEQSEYSKIK